MLDALDGGTRANRLGQAGSRNVEGVIVGANAPEIDADNVGRALLAKMGWTKGMQLGLSGGGATTHVTAVVKTSKRGLGHFVR